jgi:cell wall-associated NlpC family hydrolase
LLKRILASMLLLSAFATVTPSMDQASAAGTTYYVNVKSGSLNLRKSPSTSATVVTKLAKGQLVTVATQSKGWAKITANGKQGFVSTQFITPKTTAAKAPATPASTANYRQKAISTAKSNLGVKYVWGGRTTSGFDCSGLVGYSFGKAGINLPRTAAEMYNKGKAVSTSSLIPGDLLFYATNGGKKVTHVAIYLGNGQMIHAATSKGVSIANLNNTYWKPKFVGAKRI